MVDSRQSSFFKRRVQLRKYNNVVEAGQWATVILKLSGTVVYELQIASHQVTKKFSLFGFAVYVAMFSIYLYCSYKTHSEDQTILRMLYNTKLQRYGDDFERASSTVYVVLSLLLNPFRVNYYNREVTQKIVDTDLIIENTGDIINYDSLAHTALSISVSQLVVCVIRFVCIYMVVNANAAMPLEKISQVCISDCVAIITSALYCYYLIILIGRFNWINKTLNGIRDRNSWEHKVFVRGSLPVNVVKLEELQERQICQKIKTCAKVYSKMYDICQATSYLFGVSLLLTLLHYFNYIILYLFYFMEAHAAGLFYDVPRYFNFIVYTFWETFIAIGIVFLIIVFSEITTAHAKRTSFIIHEIINEDFSPAINEEAMKFSAQLLHEIPDFTVCGLFKLDYAYFLQAIRSISTYLVILLQFVTEH